MQKTLWRSMIALLVTLSAFGCGTSTPNSLATNDPDACSKANAAYNACISNPRQCSRVATWDQDCCGLVNACAETYNSSLSQHVCGEQYPLVEKFSCLPVFPVWRASGPD
jgi:hypothetical protein